MLFLTFISLKYVRSDYVFCFRLQKLLWEILENHGKDLTIESIISILDCLYILFNQNNSDLLPGPQKVLYQLSVDFVLALGMYNDDDAVQVLDDGIK
jgi:hypothetical protein